MVDLAQAFPSSETEQDAILFVADEQYGTVRPVGGPLDYFVEGAA